MINCNSIRNILLTVCCGDHVLPPEPGDQLQEPVQQDRELQQDHQQQAQQERRVLQCLQLFASSFG